MIFTYLVMTFGVVLMIVGTYAAVTGELAPPQGFWARRVLGSGKRLADVRRLGIGQIAIGALLVVIRLDLLVRMTPAVHVIQLVLAGVLLVVGLACAFTAYRY